MSVPQLEPESEVRHDVERDRLLSTHVAARRLAIHPKTLTRWIRARRFPAVVLDAEHPNGIRYRVRERDLAAWIDAHRSLA